MTKLTNSQGKVLYTNPENVKKAMKRRKSVLYGNKIAKHIPGLTLFIKDAPRALTI